MERPSSSLTIRTVMHPAPHSVGSRMTLRVALDLMREHRCRHLPVQERGELLGILSDRDINFALRVDGRKPEELQVRDAFTEEPYTVDPETAVWKVAAKMAHEHIGCALVTDQGKLVGIFTTVDACRLLSELLAGRTEQ